ncbi:hypothetical protein R3P38DRAFT_2793015 [Favolaschia claudopus]|uniref:Uncharacterized protein n=1 Tax=Favolaschia claudopus TaxID=2862362 RepID=A0AAW0ADR2_9AGAR
MYGGGCCRGGEGSSGGCKGCDGGRKMLKEIAKKRVAERPVHIRNSSSNTRRQLRGAFRRRSKGWRLLRRLGGGSVDSENQFHFKQYYPNLQRGILHATSTESGGELPLGGFEALTGVSGSAKRAQQIEAGAGDTLSCGGCCKKCKAIGPKVERKAGGGWAEVGGRYTAFPVRQDADQIAICVTPSPEARPQRWVLLSAETDLLGPLHKLNPQLWQELIGLWRHVNELSAAMLEQSRHISQIMQVLTQPPPSLFPVHSPPQRLSYPNSALLSKSRGFPF